MKVESEELRQQMLQLAGEELSFADFTIYGYPGFSTTRLYDGEASLYHVDKMEFNFRITTLDGEANGVKKGDTFTFSDETYIFTFKLEADPIPDLTGFSKLHVIYKGRENV